MQQRDRSEEDPVDPPDQKILSFAMRDKSGRDAQQYGKDQKIRCHLPLTPLVPALSAFADGTSYNIYSYNIDPY